MKNTSTLDTDGIKALLISGLIFIGAIILLALLHIIGEPSEEQHRQNLLNKYQSQIESCKTSSMLSGYISTTKFIEDKNGHATGVVVYESDYKSEDVLKMIGKNKKVTSHICFSSEATK